MNGAHLHLMLVHFPIAGMVLAVPLLITAWVLKNETVKLVGLAFVVVIALLGWGAYMTGDDARAIVRTLPDISGAAIHEHSLAADWGIWAMGLDGLLAALGLFLAWKNRKLPHWAFVTVTIVTIWGSTVLIRVGYLGGQIHHPETHSDFVVPTPGPGE